MGLSGGPSNVEYRTFLAIEKLRNRYFQKNKKARTVSPRLWLEFTEN